MSNTENTPNNDASNNGNDSPDLSISANSLGGLAPSQAAVLHAVLPDSVVSEALNNVQVSWGK
jgi:hypothetical protein